MPHPLTRAEALRALDLPASADPQAVKRAYRRLAREHHPDVGGDPATFQHLQRAYERLRDDNGPLPPVVSRGRPSRPTAQDEVGAVDLGSVDWEGLHPDGEVALSRQGLALLLARDHAGAVHPVLAASRAPGSRLNRLAAVLAGDFTARLRIGPERDHRGREAVGLEVRAANRAARRALDRVPLGAAWSRTRTSSSTLLRSMLLPSEDRHSTALRATDRVQALLDGLGWSLPAWRVMRDGADD